MPYYFVISVVHHIIIELFQDLLRHFIFFLQYFTFFTVPFSMLFLELFRYSSRYFHSVTYVDFLISAFNSQTAIHKA